MRSGGCPILMVTLIVVIIISSLYINKNCLRNNLKLAQEKPQVIVETKIVYITVTVPTEKTTTKKKTVRTTTEKVKESKFVDVNHVRSEKVKEMMLHAWDNYKLYTWGENELATITKSKVTNGIFGVQKLGLTIVDSIDTLYIMGLKDEFEDAKDWIAEKFSFKNISGKFSVFETNIRFVGGLLSCYALTGDEMFKDKAKYVADQLLPAFDTVSGIPKTLIDFEHKSASYRTWKDDMSTLSELGSLHLEFYYLSDITGDPIYRKMVEKIRTTIDELYKPRGLYPDSYVHAVDNFGEHDFSIGTSSDSFFEYILKGWIQSGKTKDADRKMFDEAMEAIIEHLVVESSSGLTYIASESKGNLSSGMDHFSCFAGGLFALGAHTKRNYMREKYRDLSEEVTKTCHESYIRSHTHLGPDYFRFDKNVEAMTQDDSEATFLLRPEVVESYFVMWRVTHNQKYRDWGWDVVLSIDKYCRSDNGFSGIKNVYSMTSTRDNVQQSFFLAETLKYLYLLFSDDSLLSLDDWVFNTEAHPLPIKGRHPNYRFASHKNLTTKPPQD